MNTTNTEDLSSWEAARLIWGLPGMAIGTISMVFAALFSIDDKANLLPFIQTLLEPNAVLIGAAVVAITFASNWNNVDSGQAKLRNDLILGSMILSVSAVLGFLVAGIYIAVASDTESLALIDAESVLDVTGPVAIFFLTWSLGGLATLIIRLWKLVSHQTGEIKDDPSTPKPET